MDVKRAEQVEALVTNATAETAVLEFKQSLTLGKRVDRIETLKDLSGMGNGGGGTIVYGVAERDGGVAAAIEPLTQLADVGRLEDLVRSAIRPPLLWTVETIPVDGGFVLSIEVLRSPLGPYMVEAYEQRRYFTRSGTSTMPMTEQQVRDAYALGARGREQRPETWAFHELPLVPTWQIPWLVVSALPEEPLVDLIDPAVVPTNELQPPPEIHPHTESAGLNGAMARMHIWADGVFAEDRFREDQPPETIVRIHRDGSAGLAVRLYDEIFSTTILRPLHAQLLYLGWLWNRFGPRTPVELDVRLLWPSLLTMKFGPVFEDRKLSVPDGVTIDSIGMRREVLAADLRRASIRHGLVVEMANRVRQAYGFSRAELALTTGKLYGRDGTLVGLAVHGSFLWDVEGRPVAIIFDNGRVDDPARGSLVGFIREGVLLDEEGRTMALLEFGTGAGVPDDFLHRQFPDDPRARTAGDSGSPGSDPRATDPPDPTGEWSPLDLGERLRADAVP